MQVRILVLTNFTYTYGSLSGSRQCGQWLYFDSSIQSELDELDFILSSSFFKRGLLYVDETIIEDYTAKQGIFTAPTAYVDNVNLSDLLSPSPINTEAVASTYGVLEPTLEVENTHLSEVVEVEVEEVTTVADNEPAEEGFTVVEPEYAVVPTSTKEVRKLTLQDTPAAEVRVIAEGLGLADYTNKAKAIDFILSHEYQ